MTASTDPGALRVKAYVPAVLVSAVITFAGNWLSGTYSVPATVSELRDSVRQLEFQRDYSAKSSDLAQVRNEVVVIQRELELLTRDVARVLRQVAEDGALEDGLRRSARQMAREFDKRIEDDDGGAKAPKETP